MKKTYILLLSFMFLLLVDDVKAQLKLGDQPTSVQKSVILDLQGSNGRQGVWLPRISDTTDATGIDALNPPDGVLIYHSSAKKVMIRVNGYWQVLEPTTGVYTISNGAQSVNGPDVTFETGTAAGGSKDFNISIVPGQDKITFNLPDASNDTRGVVTALAQSFGGLKTFQDGLTSETTTTVNGSSANASNLYLGISSSTSPGTTTDRFLSVNGSGRVVLSEGIPSNRSLTINGTAYDLSANRTWSVGTVTSVAAGYGISGGTITGSGTHSVDSFSIATRAWRQKGIDSVAGLLNAYVPATRTLNGLAMSSNQTFATGTSGADFNISSSGTTHTFNIPDASVTARGLVTTGNQTFDGIKTFQDPVSARVNLQAGTATAGTAPLKFTSGTNLTTPENGAVEYNGTNYFATSGGVRYTLAKTLTNTATLDFPNTGPVTTSTLTITVTGAADGDVVSLGVPTAAINTNCAYIAYVSATNTVTVAFINYSGGNVNPASGTFRASVLKY